MKRFSHHLIILSCFLLTACARAATVPTTTPESVPDWTLPSPTTAPTFPPDDFSDLPDESRTATRQGDPRPGTYWSLWNTCAPDNRADTAAANGGREAGWFLMDDFLSYPGVQLGDYLVPSCQEGLALLLAQTAAGEEANDQVYGLASALLAAELNLSANAESCPIAEEAVVGAHLVLSGAGFNGRGDYTAALSGETASAIPRLVELLEGYNRGELCR